MNYDIMGIGIALTMVVVVILMIVGTYNNNDKAVLTRKLELEKERYEGLENTTKDIINLNNLIMKVLLEEEFNPKAINKIIYQLPVIDDIHRYRAKLYEIYDDIKSNK